MQSLRILHSECSTGWGGQEIRIFTEMKAMRARGHELFLASPMRTSLYRRCRESGFPVFDFNDAKWSYPAAILKLAGIFKKEKIQVVNMHSSRDGWVAGVAARMAGVPLIIRSRHIDVAYPNRLMSRLVYHRIPHHVLTTSARIATNIIEALDLDSEHVTCVPTGIDLQRFHPEVKSLLRSQLGVKGRTKLIGMVSVLRSWKGHDYFLEAVDILSRQRDDLRFVIAGDGPMKDHITQRIYAAKLHKVVTMLGHRDDVENVLAALDVLALPSYAHEGIPQILLQALAMGKPVVASRVGGIPEIITDGETGLLVEPQNSSALAREILELAGSSDFAKKMAQKGREKVVKHHSLEAMCGQLEQIYQRYLG